MLYVADVYDMDCVGYWLSQDYLCVLFFSSVFSIICHVTSISNYRWPAWIANVFLAAFHIVFVTYLFVHVLW